MDSNKDKVDPDFMYTSCTTRSDRDAYRICPSKLTKRELEDLYFTVLEENMEQKKTISGQQDRIRMLNTKVHRMFSAQKVQQADERKDCCVITKCMVDQHKQSILELKRTNDRMAERIRQLNAQLTAARQISKNRIFCGPKCPKPSPAISPCLTDDNMSNKSIETQTELSSLSQVCEENKCRTLMDELKQKIVNLEEELAITHNEYSSRMSRLEKEILQFQNRDVHNCTESIAVGSELQQNLNQLETGVESNDELAELKKQLLIEKRKVAELETRLQAAVVSSVVTNNMAENHLSIMQEQPPVENKEWEDSSWDCNCTPSCPHSKPVCTVLRLLNRGLLTSAKNLYSGETKAVNDADPSLNKNATEGRYSGDNNEKSLDPNLSTNKRVLEVQHNEITGNGNSEHLDNKYLPQHGNRKIASISIVSPDVEHKISLDDQDRQEKKDTYEYNDQQNITLEPKQLPSVNTHHGYEVVAKYDLSNERKKYTAGQNYKDVTNITHEHDRTKGENDPRNVSEVDKRQELVTEVEELSYNDPIQTTNSNEKSRNTPKVRNIIKNDNIPDLDVNKDTPNYKQRQSSIQMEDHNRPPIKIRSDSLEFNVNTSNRKQEINKAPPLHIGSPVVKESSKSQHIADKFIGDENQCVDDKNRYNDDGSQVSVDRSQKIYDGENSQIWLQNPDATTNLLPENNSKSQRISCPERSYKINFYHKCGCWAAGKDQPETDSNENKNIAQPVRDGSGNLNLSDSFKKPSLNSGTVRNIRDYNENKDLASNKNLNETNIEKNYNLTLPNTFDNEIKTNLIPNTNQDEYLAEASVSHNLSAHKNGLSYTNVAQNQLKCKEKEVAPQIVPDVNSNINSLVTNVNAILTEEIHNSPTYDSKSVVDNSGTDAHITLKVPDSNENKRVSKDYIPNVYDNGEHSLSAKKGQNVANSVLKNYKTQNESGPKISSNSPDTFNNKDQDMLHVRMSEHLIKSDKEKDASPTDADANLADVNINERVTDIDGTDKIPDCDNGHCSANDANKPTSNINNDTVKTRFNAKRISDASNISRGLTEADMIRNIRTFISSVVLPKVDEDESNSNETKRQSDINNKQNLDLKIKKHALPEVDTYHITPDTTKTENPPEPTIQRGMGQTRPDFNQNQVPSNSRQDQDQTESKPHYSKKNVLEPYSITDPSQLAEDLTDICQEQLETIAELERQLNAKKAETAPKDKLNLRLGDYFNTDEDDVISIPFKKDNWSKGSMEPIKTSVKIKTGDDFSNKLWTNKQKLKQESLTKPPTNGTRSTLPKNDQHNSLQIPGPIPSTSVQSSNWKTNVLKHFSPKKRNPKENNKKTKESSSNTGDDTLKGPSETISALGGETVSLSGKEKKPFITDPKPEKVLKSRLKKRDPHNDGLSSPAKYLANQKRHIDPGTLMVKCMEISMMQAAETSEKDSEVDPAPQSLEIQTPDIHADVPVPPQRELKTYRNKEGTLCFETKPPMDRSRCCQCDRRVHCEDYTIKGTQPQGKPENISTFDQSTSTTIHDERPQCLALHKVGYLDETPGTPPGTPASTYDGSSYNANTRSASIATNRPSASNIEMLPIAAAQKPGPSADNKEEEQSIKFSITTSINSGEILYSNETLTPETVNKIPKEDGRKAAKAKSMQNMEEKLQALTDEIAYCKKMLLAQQTPQENQDQADSIQRKEAPRSVLSDLDDEESKHMLKRGVALHTIGDTYSPRCVFMLHVGTVVLSDEAVLTTHDRSLILTWKFYNQNVTITRMNAGRVMLFDFSSEYDIQMTDEFLEYMKCEHMTISICELNNLTEPYATCSLPLRDALLHTNSRADMSLELVAGPQMIHARDKKQISDALDAGDEVGVIDLWCMLRADAKILPMITRAMARRTSMSKEKKPEPRSDPLIDDYEEENDVTSPDMHMKVDQSFQDMRDLDNKKLRRWGSSILRLPSREWSSRTPYDDEDDTQGPSIYSRGKKTNGSRIRGSNVSHSSHTKRKSTLPSLTENNRHRRQSSMSEDLATQVSNASLTPQYDPSKYPLPRTDSRQRTQELELDNGQGGILINEVIANIKTPDDMRLAMENIYRNSLHHVARLPRNEDDITSQAQSGSFNFIRSWLNKRAPDKTSCKSGTPVGSAKFRRNDDSQPALVLPEEPSDNGSIYRKYDNISKVYSSKSDIKKQVTISTHGNYINDVREAPQKDEPDDDAIKDFDRSIDITILWLALNEECEAMCNPRVQRVYVAYSFLGRSGADMETPFSLPKPKHHVDKCYFNFKKTFQVDEEDVSILGHMARCRASSRVATDFKDCIVFSVISEPPEDPLGLDTCEDIGYAFLYLGDLLAYSAGSPGYTEVVPVRARGGSSVCGVLAVRLDGLDVLRRCATLTAADTVPSIE